jgi:hypothetical protein
VPSQKNNYRSKALHIHFLTYYLLAALILSFAYNPLTHMGQKVLGISTDINPTKLLELTNIERQKEHLSPLQYNAKLEKAATEKAKNMFAHNYWAHYGPDGASPWDFILATGYKYEYAGENLAKDFMFSNDVVTAWMNSPTHRANIIKPEYSEIGFSVTNGVLNGEETTLVVQMFGKPLISAGENNNSPSPAAISPIPLPTVEIINDKGSVLSSDSLIPPPSHVDIRSLTSTLMMVFLTFLLIAIIFDLYFGTKLKLNRQTGKHLAHAIFIVFIMVGIGFIIRGNIL